MDPHVALKQLEKYSEPLLALENIFGDASLETWLQRGLDEALCKCLTELIEGLPPERHSRKIDKNKKKTIRKYLAILNAIIPPLPNFMEGDFEDNSTYSKSCQNRCNLIDILISKIMKPMFAVFIENQLYMEMMSEVLLKIIFHASVATIKENDDVFSENLVHLMEAVLKPCCYSECHTLIAFLIILARKMSGEWLVKVLDPKIVLMMRIIVLRNGEKNCPYVNNLRKHYIDLDLENKLKTIDPNWNQLLDIQHAFQGQSLVMALKCISQLIGENKLCAHHFIQSGLLHKFHSLLCNPSEVGETTFVIKSFLSVFFEVRAENGYFLKTRPFKELIILLRRSLLYFVFILQMYPMRKSVHIKSPSSTLTVATFQKDVIVVLNVLQSLYVLNSSWYQWFDITKKSEIISKKLFKCIYFTWYLKEEDNHEISVWYTNMTKLCPALVPIRDRVNMLKKSLPARRAKKYFEVSRNNVIEDIIEIFQNNGDYFYDYWIFTFKGETGRGYGVTKEVYSILSQDLRTNDINFWLEEPLEATRDVLSTFTNLSTCIFPKNKEYGKFKFFGQILAKAILDGHMLDIQLSTEFFQKLRTVRHSHLRKDYYDLVRVFPMLEFLFKQLLPVKRKVECIKSEASYSHNQKREIISNLTFDDGNSFDDLCLNFTVPGSDIELIDGGRDVMLSANNIDLYLEKLCAYKDQMAPMHQLEAIRQGFDQVLPGSIELFLPEELKKSVCCDSFKRLTMDELYKCCDYENSQSVQFLFQSLASFDTGNQRMFLKFATGMSGLPFGGLRSLIPRLTISKVNHDNPDSYLPTAATCFNRLCLPDYSSLYVTRQKLLIAINEGNNSVQLV